MGQQEHLFSNGTGSAGLGIEVGSPGAAESAAGGVPARRWARGVGGGQALTRRLATIVPVAGVCSLLLALPGGLVRDGVAHGPQRGSAVASEAPLAADAAMAQLKAGGNAVDAAVAAAFVAGVVNSSSSGIGGGGFVNFYSAKERRAIILDFREVAPKGIVAEELEQRPLPFSQRGKLAGVPGEVAGLYELHRRYGTRPWRSVVIPAAQAAADGFVVREHMDKMLRWTQKKLASDPGLKTLWLGSGRIPAAGARVKAPQLARTLAAIANQGPKAFYEGAVAADIVETVRGAGGSMTLQDLQDYRVEERAPLVMAWNGYQVHTMPPPSAGGYMLMHTLGLYSPQHLRGLKRGSAAYVHALAESFRAALADRYRYLGDPAHAAKTPSALLGSARLKERRRGLDPNKTHTIADFPGEEHGTHHLVTADAGGNVVSITLTVNRAFGSKLRAAKSGVVLNDELDDFSKNSWMAPFGLKESPNRPRPGARPVSSMTPTVISRDGKAVLAIGGSGGMNIATNVTQLVVDRLLFNTELQQLVSQPRFQVPSRGGTLRLPWQLMGAFQRELEERGEEILPVRFATSGVQALSLDGALRTIGADPRKYSKGLAY